MKPAEPLRIEQFTSARKGRPFWVRALNTAGRLAPGFARPSADAWWEAARRRARGCGEPTPHAREAFAALAESLARDAHLHFIGRFSARDDSLRMAATHLRVQHALRENSAIENVALPQPIFVIG
jgi:hypothetical protein